MTGKVGRSRQTSNKIWGTGVYPGGHVFDASPDVGAPRDLVWSMYYVLK
jgi:hypothetical protein